MGKLKWIGLRSATLVETIVALIIILVLTGISVVIFVQVMASGYSTPQIKAEALIEEYIVHMESGKAFFEEEITDGEFILKKEIIEDNSGKNAVKVKLSVYDQDNRLVKYQCKIILGK